MTDINVGGLEAAEPATGKTAVSAHGDAVVLHFEKPIEYAVYAPAGAISDGAKMLLCAAEVDPKLGQLVIDVAAAIVDGIYSQRGELKPADGAMKREMVERHRRTLTKRVEVMLNSTRERKRMSNPAMARELVDVCLSDIFGRGGLH